MKCDEHNQVCKTQHKISLGAVGTTLVNLGKFIVYIQT